MQDRNAIRRMKERAFTKECQVTGGGQGGLPPPNEDPDLEAVGNPQYEPNPLPANKFTPPNDDSGIGSSIFIDENAVDSTANVVIDEVGNTSQMGNTSLLAGGSAHMYSRPSSSQPKGNLFSFNTL